MCQTKDLEKRCVPGSSKFSLQVPSKVTPADHDKEMGAIISSSNAFSWLLFRLREGETMTAGDVKDFCTGQVR